MPIILKPNPRIQLSSCHQWGLLFAVDGKKTVNFYTEESSVQSVILDFMHHGGTRDSIITRLVTNNQRSKVSQFINSLELNSLIDQHFHFENCNMVAIAYSVHSCTLPQKNEVFTKGLHKLSRFAYFCIENNNVVLKSPLARQEFKFSPNLFTRLFPILTSKDGLQVIFDIFPEHLEEAATLIQLLIENKILESVDSYEDDCLKTWEFHDLLFHICSRRGHSDDDAHFGATNRFQNTKLSTPPAFKHINTDEMIKLDMPTMKEIFRDGFSFSQVLESRRSHRVFNGKHPISIKKLAEFLYRSIGIREVVPAPIQDAVFRPYPSAGAIHEFECYIVINKCDGLKQGIYYYDPVQHSLRLENNESQNIEKMISQASTAMGPGATQPQLLIVLTSRFKKIAWKYEKMAYRSTLISLGGIFQTMSLVATSMQLGSCIVGSGDSYLFAEALRIPALQEGAVGELAIGSL